MKPCRECGIKKDLTRFYKNSCMRDGRLNTCKDCAKINKLKYNLNHRQENSKYSKKYRIEHPNETKASQSVYHKSAAGKAAARRTRCRYPNAVKSRDYYGKRKDDLIIPDNCQLCGDTHEKLEAHHSDYNKPMEVLYLCNWCHAAWHKHNIPFNRVSGIFTEVKK